jgi:hypothetical protein
MRDGPTIPPICWRKPMGYFAPSRIIPNVPVQSGDLFLATYFARMSERYWFFRNRFLQTPPPTQSFCDGRPSKKVRRRDVRK